MVPETARILDELRKELHLIASKKEEFTYLARHARVTKDRIEITMPKGTAALDTIAVKKGKTEGYHECSHS